ncbi:HU family DNA-binding protein [Epilithonimonas ginsengisoli]|uniref:HU family DNA-binding protein n=1 Tax=Epilithonimonas ginsengisoli TaxID=1245592 RepID=A0ABU4JMS0_9FLAO|nr:MULTISPECIES: HU family DNA-binding protein [Chryseobacterium group]MBV6880305.1 HU family DNA-binding protein [Epilithonimonas sp. FP105]MDW8551003.1 HU family DNA-binding protein [Epilithonimonas ginsengisoli]OAH65385.1 DNA-binding protein [Chryseobacterium sp. FP211-J200]
MSVQYSLSEKGNPAKPAAPKKFYAIARSTGEVTFRSLSKEIAAASTTVSDTDVLAVLNDLSKALARNLGEGRIVRFGDFGSFSLRLSSEGAETEKKFSPALIKSAKISFRPGIDLKEMLATLKFEKGK